MSWQCPDALVRARSSALSFAMLMSALVSVSLLEKITLEGECHSSKFSVWQAHQDRNEARMLTPAERKEKKLSQLVGEAAPDTLVALFKVSHPHSGARAFMRCLIMSLSVIC